MLLQQIREEYLKLNNIVSNLDIGFSELMELYQMEYNQFKLSELLHYSNTIRDMSKVEVLLTRERYYSKSVQNYSVEFINLLRIFFKEYDTIMNMLSQVSDKKSIYDSIDENIRILKSCTWDIIRWYTNMNFASDLLFKVADETWEPLPIKLKTKCEDIAISSETKGTTLGDVSKDIESLDVFLHSIYLLLNKDKKNNYFLRKVETGSLEVVISCVTAAAPIISFIFFIIKLCQNAEKRTLNNKDKRLELINKNLDMAKKILEINPQNTEANEIIQRCGLYLLQYLENNPRGTINGEKYDIGTEVLKIEKKDE